MSMFIMLAVIYMTVARLGKQGVPAVPPALPPVADRPTDGKQSEDDDSAALVADRDPREAEAFAREAQAVMDRSTMIHAIENPAYYRLLRWTMAQGLSAFARRTPQETAFQDLVGRPDASRGELIEVELSVRFVRTYDVPPEKSGGAERVYELWGWPTSGRGWFYVVVTPELPEGFPIAPEVNETARVRGYFLKLQGYEPADAKPFARPLVAPLVIGRVVAWQPPPPPPASEITPAHVVLVIGCAALLCAIAYWLWTPRRRGATGGSASPDWPPAHAPISRSGAAGDAPGASESGTFDWVRDIDHCDE
ncbi:MAG: hypothetical protein HYX69_11060 [Planctomycetia bacterium]|nr:hypothetical protein [Planctomycetia bacterium]